MRAKSAGHSGADADAFDRWLRRSLRSEFDAVAMEPVPEALLRVLDEALAAAAAGSAEAGTTTGATADAAVHQQPDGPRRSERGR